VLTRLYSLYLGFESPRSHPPPLLIRSILPALTRFEFQGASDYWEGPVNRIYAPRLDALFIDFSDGIVFDTPQLVQFGDRIPSLKVPQSRRHVAQ
jgi:hypothetical protein